MRKNKHDRRTNTKGKPTLSLQGLNCKSFNKLQNGDGSEMFVTPRTGVCIAKRMRLTKYTTYSGIFI